MLDLRKSKGGDTRELQSKMVPPKKTGSGHLKVAIVLAIKFSKPFVDVESDSI